MNKLLILIITIFFSFKCFSQRVFVLDSIDKNPLAFVGISHKNGGLYTNEKGWFLLEDVEGELIELSLLGYETKQLPKNKIKDTIFLTMRSTLLDEVTVIKKRNKEELVTKQPKKTRFYGSTVLQPKHEILLVLMPKGILNETYIDDVTLFFNKKLGLKKRKKARLNGIEGIIRFNLYKVSNQKPSKQIYESEPLKISSFKKDEISISLSDKLILFPNEGICIGIEMIGYYNESYDEVKSKNHIRPQLTPQEYKHFKALTYKRFSFPINAEQGQMILMKDFLSQIGADSKHLDRNLAVGLKLSSFSD